MTKMSEEDLLLALLEAAATQCGIEKDKVEDIYPCTSLQEGMFAISIAQPGTYVSQMVFSLPETLPLDQFRNAWQSTVEAHSILRTRIVHVAPHGTLQVVVRENIAWNTASTLEEYLETDRVLIAHGVKLTRFGIVDDSRGRYFIWSAHHALYDGWSRGIIFSHVEHIFLRRSIPGPSPPFSRFIEYLANMDDEVAAKFWTSQLSGARPASFPQSPTALYQPRPDQEQRHTLLVPQRAENVTTSTILRAAWAVVLAKYCDTDDVIFGAPLSGRNAPIDNIHRIVGPTITTVPIKISLDRSQTVKDFLWAVQKQAIDMIPHEHSGLQNIRRLSSVPEGTTDLKNLLVIQPRLESGQAPNFLGLESVPVDTRGFESYALILECGVEDDKVEIEARHDSLVLSAAQTRRMLLHFEQVARQLWNPSDQITLNELKMFTESDWAKISEWNHSVPTLPVDDRCLHELFVEQSRQRPNSPAVCAWDAQLTYRELDEMSTRLASHLQTLLVGPEVIVPICFDKSAYAIISMLAVLKAGGACTALNPEYPKQRLHQLVAETNASVVLASPIHAHLFEKTVTYPIGVNQTLLKTLPRVESLPLTAVATQAAFIVFTSGSTGVPKGVVLEHRALSSSIYAHGTALEFDSRSRVLQFSSYTFDVSIAEIFTTFLYGGCVVVPSDHDRLNNLIPFIVKNNINLAILTPTVLNMLSPDDMPMLQTVIMTGEAGNSGLVRRWAEKVHLSNLYGPAECSVWSAGQIGMTKTSIAGGIGHGLSATLWIVDPIDSQQLAPIGTVGELLIGGPILSRGYLNDSEKTATAFIENPSWLSERKSTDCRLYKTGDLVRYNADGTVHYVGRKDSQIKLHGQRLELAEIEHHLSLSEAKYAAVVLPTVGRCQKQLVAAVVLHDLSKEYLGNNSIELVEEGAHELVTRQLQAIQSFLSDKVPHYFIPAVWVVVKALPVNPSGKLDRSTLQKWIEAMDENMHQRVLSMISGPSISNRAPTELEEKLQGVWARVLGIPTAEIGLNRAFTSLGGDSISAMQIRAQCRAVDISVTVQDVLRCNIAQLAKRVKSVNQHVWSNSEVMDTAFDLSPIQKLYFAQIAPPNTVNGQNYSGESLGEIKNLNDAEQHAFNQNLLVRLTETMSAKDVERAVNEIVARHAMLRARFTREDGGRWSQRTLSHVAGSYGFESVVIENHTDHVFPLASALQARLNIKDGPVFAAGFYDVRNKISQNGVEPHGPSGHGANLLDLQNNGVQSNGINDCALQINGNGASGIGSNGYHNDTLQTTGDHGDIKEERSQFLFLVAHHLVVDLVSWRIILADIERFLRTGALVKEKPLSFQVWCREQAIYSREDLKPDAVLPIKIPLSDYDYWGMGNQENLQADVLVEECTLDASKTRKLFGQCNESLHTDPTDIILAALFSSSERAFSDRSPPAIYYEGHGREPWNSDTDISETVGWFTTITPLFIPTHKPSGDIIEAIRLTKDIRRRIPRNGLPYFTSRFLTTKGAEIFRGHELMEIVFNYFGRAQQLERTDSLFSLGGQAPEPSGQKVRRLALFDISAVVDGDIAQFSFKFNRRMRHHNKIRDWVLTFQSLLEDAIEKLYNRPVEHTLSDFPQLPLTYPGLERLKEYHLPNLGVACLGEVEDIYPCSPMQDGILISQARTPETYRVVQLCEVLPALDGESVKTMLLRQAWQKVVDRHASLRTIFVEIDGLEPHENTLQSTFSQLVLKRYLHWAPILQCASEDATEFLLKQPALDYNSAKGRPLHQFTICETPSRRVFFKLEINHALTDGTSMAILTRDLNLAYQDQLTESGPLYAEFIAHLQLQDTRASLDFWETYLAGVQPCRLPTLPGGDGQEREHQSVPVRLDSKRMQKFCSRHGLTITNILQAAWTLVLRYYTACDDVCFGYLASGRDIPIDSIYDAVGPFINMLVCRPNVTGETSGLRLVEKVQEGMLKALEHQHTPLIDVQHALDIGHTGLFNSVLSVQRQISQPIEESGFGGITLNKVGGKDPTEVRTLQISSMSG